MNRTLVKMVQIAVRGLLMLKFSQMLIFTLILFLSVANKVQAGSSYAGNITYIYGHCGECHGNNGLGSQNNTAPKIAGMEEWYIIEQLKKFRQGIRGANSDDLNGKIMAPLSKMLNGDKAIEDLAAHLSQLKGKTEHELTGNTITGERLYEKLCVSCHGEQGQGNLIFKAPKLTGMNDWYIYGQLRKFKSNVRGTHPQDIGVAQMRAIAKTIPTKQAMKDISVYISTIIER